MPGTKYMVLLETGVVMWLVCKVWEFATDQLLQSRIAALAAVRPLFAGSIGIVASISAYICFVAMAESC